MLGTSYTVREYNCTSESSTTQQGQYVLSCSTTTMPFPDFTDDEVEDIAAPAEVSGRGLRGCLGKDDKIAKMIFMGDSAPSSLTSTGKVPGPTSDPHRALKTCSSASGPRLSCWVFLGLRQPRYGH